MRTIYSGFDKLEVSYKGQISEAFQEKLEQAQANAVMLREPVLIQYGGVKLHVAESGGQGGYAFRCDTGPLGGIWTFKRPNGRDPWGIRFSARALLTAQHGLDGTRKHIEETLAALGCILFPEPESIARVDFAIDILAPGFELNPENFVIHARATRADFEEIDVRQSHGKSGRYTSVTVGKMPGRQLIVYDKRLEVMGSPQKAPWLDIWKAEMAERELPPIDFKDRHAGAIWRVEIRAGKTCLKERHKITSWGDLYRELENVLSATLSRTKYTRPISDTNRSRWPEHAFWELARAEVDRLDFSRTGLVEDDRVLEGCRKAQLEVIDQQMVGLSATRVALASPVDARGDQFRMATDPVRRATRFEGDKFADRVDKARERYSHLR